MSGGPRRGPSSEPRVDLHSHSHFSDGDFPPQEVATMASRAALAACALTDHDCVDGLPEFRDAANGFEPIDGVEISALREEVDVHVVGLFIDPGDETLRRRLRSLSEARVDRLHGMVDRLRGLGVSVTVDEVTRLSGRGTVGRVHVARALADTGATDSVEDSFRRYLRRGRPAFVPKPGPSPEEAIGWIRDAGGVAVLAHPGLLYHDEWIPGFAAAGLAGLEVWHPKHRSRRRAVYAKMARDLDLVPSGGSDYHGVNVGDARIGQEPVPADTVERLRRRRPPR